MTNVLGCSDTLIQPAFIQVYEPPTTAFNLSDTAGCTPFAFTTQDLSTGNSASVIAWAWDFGDGTTSTAQNPSHTYTAIGQYTLQLVTTDANGCRDTLTQLMEAYSLPNAGFFSPDTAGCAPHVASFRDVSTGAYTIAAWAWDFGDGNTSNLQNPNHTYTADGRYTVQLIVWDVHGCSDTLIQPDYIILSNPDANFTQSDTSGCPGLAVQFTDTSIPDVPLISWQWDFGDGNTSTLQNPQHSYTNPGRYDVRLVVTNVNNCTDTIIVPQAVRIYNRPIAGIAVSDNDGCIPFGITFSDASTPTDGVLANWVWDYGDGNSGAGSSSGHVYTAPGVYAAQLIVSDVFGCSDTTTVSLEAFPLPTVDFVADDSVGCAPQTITFSNRTQSTNNIVTWEWDFGDGNTSTQASPAHTYSANGIYTVSLIATDVNGCQDTLIKPAYIRLSHPVADFSESTTYTCPGTVVTFQDNSIPDTTLTTWFWDFGDGNTSNLQNPTHIYTSGGLFTVRLVVTNVLGCSDTLEKASLIDIPSAPTPAFTPSTLSGCVPATLDFVNNSTANTASISGYQWDFGNGQTSTLANPVGITYPNIGTYTVRLVAIDVLGCSDTAFQTIAVNGLPTAGFIADDSIGCAPKTFRFTDRSQSPVSIQSWQWHFGDGATSTAQNPAHTYQSDGLYTVSLVVTDVNGCTDSMARPAYIRLTRPAADFSLSSTQTCPGTSISLFDQTNPDTTLASWQWDFGDGNSSTLQNPTHMYTTGGNYPLQLIVTNVLGCSDTISRTSSIQIVTPPNGSFTPSRLIGCPPLVVDFANTSTPNTVSIAGYQWDFGNGQASTLANPSGIVYNAPGTYTVQLISTDVLGCSDTTTRIIEVFTPPIVDLVADDSLGCSDKTVRFTDRTQTNYSISNWTWSFGDGTGAAIQNPTHTYLNDGVYSVTLRVEDVNGCVDSATRANYIRLSHPVANFTSSDALSCPGTAVSFIDQSIPDTTLISWAWNFGDGGVDSVQNPQHIYPNPGSYTVQLIVTNLFGCADTIAKVDTIDVHQPPMAGIALVDTANCVPFAAEFIDSTRLTSSPITGWFWDFGDGNTSLAQNPTHTYTTPGIYRVMLVVTDALTCTDTTFLDVEAFGLPVANFIASDSLGCAGLTTTFSDQSSGPAPVVAWNWDFGDGNGSVGSAPTHTYTRDGLFTVGLVVTDANGCQDAISKADYIRLTRPVADFEPSMAQTCPATLVTFQDRTLADTTLVNWQWDFGNGTTGTGPSPTQAYTSPGSYTVTLVVTNLFGCSDTVSKVDTIEILNPPMAQFTTSADSGCTPFSLTVQDNSTASGIAVTGWEWDFGDGTTSTAQNPSHTYTTAGRYQIRLIVTDALGCQDTTYREVESLPLPMAGFFSNDTVGCAVHTSRFFDTSTSTHSLRRWKWFFGDGDSSTVQNPTHVYQGNGFFNVSLIVTDEFGCVDTLERPNYVRLSHPLADFSPVTTQACPGVGVQFTDTSVPDTTIAVWRWTFGDGSTSSLQNPVHSYASPGIYDVSLYVENVLGCGDTIFRSAVVEVVAPPAASFFPDVLAGCSPLSVAFADSSIGNASSITTWNWNFGNGNSSTVQNPSETFVGAGSYQVSLEVTDLNGCRDTAFTTIEVSPIPVADFFSNDTIGCAPQSVVFRDVSTSGPTIVSWQWDFGDGSSSNQQNPTHDYTQDGVYTVTLIISDINGCTDTLIRPNYIRLSHPQADFQVTGAVSCPGIDLSFLDTSIPDTTLIAWEWNFGDGTTVNSQNPVHSYRSPGTYTVSLIVTNVLGCSDTIVKPGAVVVNTPPVSLFAPDRDADCTPFGLSFQDSSRGNSAPIIQWDWSFGTGDSSRVQNPTYTYQTPGVYTATLVVTDFRGCKDTSTYQVEAYDLPNPNFVTIDTAGCAPISVTFSDVSTGPYPIVAWEWDFGDSTTSTLQNPVHTYSGDGSFNIQLIVTDVNGCQDTIVKPGLIKLSNPKADFAVSDADGCPGHVVNFTDQSTADTTLVSWRWDFGDGTIDSVLNPTHTYQNPGTYTVTLSVVDILGCSDTEVKTDTIIVHGPPVAAFQPDNSLGCLPFGVNFRDQSRPGTSAIASWNWNFGDGATDTAQFTNHLYTTPGVYAVTLITTDANGCADTSVVSVEGVARPVANFVASDTVSCAPISIQFTDSSSSSKTISRWLWNFGDGNTDTVQNPVHLYSQDGVYTVSLVVWDQYGCADTLVRPNYIRLSHPIAAFDVTIGTACWGSDVKFKNNSVLDTTLRSYLWDFGEGSTSNQADPIHQYNSSGVFDITLIVTNVLGCSDTLTRPGVVRIFERPNSDFNMSDSVGCAPVSTVMADRSTAAAGINFWQWTVNGQRDTTGQVFVKTFTQAGTYDVSLVVFDNNGCRDTSTRTVVVYPNPTANFRVSDTLSCAPVEISFTDMSFPVPTTWTWDFGDGNGSTAQFPKHTYMENRSYTVSLIVGDANGCTDTLTRPDLINLSRPQANFTVDFEPGCAPRDVTFTGDVDPGRNIVAWSWNFGRGLTGNGNPVVFTYPESGMYDVTLVVTDSIGCTDTVTQTGIVDIIDDVAPGPLTVHHATVVSNTAVEIRYTTYRELDFGRYVIYREEPTGANLWTEIYSGSFISDTVYVDRNLNTRDNSYCYKVVVENSCGTQIDLAEVPPHCTINLETTSLPREMLLQWNAYRGWEVEAYEIHEVNSYNPLVTNLLAIVPGNQTAYKDSAPGCFDSYSYRVKAIGQGPLQFSWSDTSTAQNWYTGEAGGSEMLRATVENNEEVLVEWKPFPRGTAVILIEKQEDIPGATWTTIGRIPGDSRKFTDLNVDVMTTSYSYRVSAQDSCDNFSEQTGIAKSILLDIDQSDGRTNLDWTPYEKWRFDVEYYEIEVFDERANAWVLVDIIQAPITSYIDEVTDLDQPSYCYRITAHELSGNNQISRSNEVCIPVLSDMHAPNAFTPNDDGVNDKFLIQGIFIDNFRISIYSRWGRKIYESDSMTEGWDGTHKGQPAPEGVYVYTVEGVGYNGKPYKLSGSITLIR
ncbi:MAG: PKD domain-containing protein [Bacteroidota bacterium]